MFLGYPLVSNMAGWQLAGKSTMNGGFKLGKSPVNGPFSRHVWFTDGRCASFCESSLTSTRSWEHEDTDFDQGMVGCKWKKHKFLSFILWYHQTWQWKMVHLYGWFMGDCPVLSYWTKNIYNGFSTAMFDYHRVAQTHDQKLVLSKPVMICDDCRW